jgi:hypothetical protein
MPIVAMASPATSRSDFAASMIADQADDAADRQHQADLDLGPFLRGQVDGDEGAKAGLDVGEEEDEPVERTQALPRRLRFAARCG